MTGSGKNQQQDFLTGFDVKRLPGRMTFGGSLLKKSHAKIARPLSSKQALHIVLKSETAKGERSFLKKERLLQNLILKQGRRHGVKVYKVSNGGTNLQLLVRFTKRRGLQNFLRSICGLIARKTLQSERGRNLSPRKNTSSPPSECLGKFWDQRPFTRIVNWGKDFASVRNYLNINLLEALGFVSRKHVASLDSKEIKKRILTQMSESFGYG